MHTISIYVALQALVKKAQRERKAKQVPSASPGSYLLPNIVVVDVCVAAVAVVAANVVAVTTIISR